MRVINMKNNRNAGAPAEQEPSRQMLRRTLLLMAVCGVAAFALLLVRLGKLQPGQWRALTEAELSGLLQRL